jgi:hypothetical protein
VDGVSIKERVAALTQQILDKGWEGMSTRYGPCEGYVYLVATQGADPLYVKIGFSRTDPRLRMASLQTGCPHHLYLLGFMAGCRNMERYFHDACREYRVSGEWFLFEPLEKTIRELLENREEARR